MSSLSFFKKDTTIVTIYVVIAIIIAVQKYFINEYNNFTIFQHSVFHFFNHQNMYLEYPEKYFDIFLYNPSFAILFTPFAYLPTFLGMMLWTICSNLLYLQAIKSLNLLKKNELFILFLILPELITSTQNLQTNPLIVAFIILTMSMLERRNYRVASIFPALNFFIKGYGGIAYAFFLLKSPRIKTFLYLIIAFSFVALLPLLFYSLDDYIQLYNEWFWSLKQDYLINSGVSLMGIIKSLIYKNASVIIIQLVGVILFLISYILILVRKNYDRIKYYFLAHLLIWVIIFNHSSESATYIIASTGVFIWYVKSNKTWSNIFLFILFFILTVISPSDLFPRYIREHYVIPYSLKALPCVLIWIKIQFTLFFPNFKLSNPILVWNKDLI